MNYLEIILHRKEQLGLTNEDFAEITGIPLPIIEEIMDGTIDDLCWEVLSDIESSLNAFVKQSSAGDSDHTTPALTFREPPSNYDAGTGQRSVRLYSIYDIMKLSEKMQIELYDGKPGYMRTPSAIHQRISGNLFFMIEQYIRSNGGKCEVFIPPFGVLISLDIYNYLIPDLMVVCDPEKIKSFGIYGAPDWVIEIVSPSSRSADYQTKKVKYRESGVHEYWIIDPEKKLVTVYDFLNAPDKPCFHSFDATISSILYPELIINMGSIIFPHQLNE